MNILDISLLIVFFFAVNFVLSGYKESFQLIPSKLKYSVLEYDEQIEKKEDCNPEFNCRRVGFYCSKIN